MERHYDEERILNAEGFISAYMHNGKGLVFTPFSDAPGHGVWEIPQSSIITERHQKNLIVTKASSLMAKRMRPATSWGAGLTHLEVGTGVGTGTTQAPQAEASGQAALRVPLLRKVITSWTNLDSSGVATGVDTNVLQLTTTFLEAEANGAVVEMGIFGGDATTTNGSGFMFNYKTFPVLNKDNTMQLTLVWKLTF